MKNKYDSGKKIFSAIAKCLTCREHLQSFDGVTVSTKCKCEGGTRHYETILTEVDKGKF